MADDDMGLGLSSDDEDVGGPSSKVPLSPIKGSGKGGGATTAGPVAGPYALGGSHPGASKVVSSYKDAKVLAEHRKHTVVLDKTAVGRRRLLEKELLEREAADNVEKARAALESLQATEAGLLAKIDSVQGSALLVVQKKREVARLNDELETIHQRMQMQSEIIAREQAVKYKAEADKDNAEFELARARSERLMAEHTTAQLQGQLEGLAALRVKVETAGVRRMKTKFTDRVAKTKEVAEEVEAEAARRAEVAQRLSQQTKEQLRDKMDAMRSQREVTAVVEKELRQKRIEAVVALKKSTDAAAEEIKGSNEARARAAKAKERAQAAVAGELLADGQNPYEVFRRKDVEKQKQRKIAAIAARTEQSRLGLTQSVLLDDEVELKVQAKEREKKRYEKEYLASLSRTVQDAKTADYIAGRTVDGSDVLDPTGRTFTVQPSQVTAIKDHGFGLGRTRADIVDKVKGKATNKSVTFDPRFVPKTLEDSDEEEAAEKAAAAAEAAELAQEAAAAAAAASAKRITLRQPSVLEQKIMAAARERQRANITKKQVVAGREYKGSGFLASPNAIIFKDFEVGKPMKIRFLFTNVSLSFNSFKVLPLPPSIRDFFDITFKPPGRMSAGMACPITVTFTAKTDEDIYDNISVLASTGPLEIPLQATSKKALPHIEAPVVNIGNVTMGEKGTASLVVTNKGALPFDVAPMRCVRDEFHSSSDAGLAAEISFSTDAVSVGPYSSASIPFTFTPSSQGWVEVAVELTYSAPSCSPQQIMVKARAMPPPVYIDTSVVDLKACVYDKLYRATIVVKNRGNNALKCLTTVPPCLRGVVEFIPDMFYLQACDRASGAPGTFDVMLKFRAPAGLLSTPALADFLTADNEFAVPTAFTCPDQVLPVDFTITGKLSSGEVTWEPAVVDFGNCYTTQSASASLAITNHSDLPQKFAFVGLPVEVTVVPNEGFGTLLPKETVHVTLQFSPTSATEHRMSLTLTTSMNATFKVPARGVGVLSPLRLSYSVIRLGAAVPGEVLSSSVFLANTSSEPVTFELIPPPAESRVTIAPLVDTIPPMGSTRVEVLFSPTAADVPAKGEDGDDNGAAGAGSGAGSASLDVPSAVGSVVVSAAKRPCEPWSKHARWTIPCFMRVGDAPTGPVTLSDSLAFELHTTVVRGSLRLDRNRVAFGPIAVGTAQLAKIRVWNDGTVEARLVLGGLNPSGSFAFVNAPRAVAPGEFQDVVVQFKPAENKRYVETPTISASHRGAALEVTLSGEGVSPSLSMEPADGVLDLGNVMAGDSATGVATLRNNSLFPLGFSVLGAAKLCSNHNGTLVFGASPLQGTIPPGGEQKVTVSFSPDHPSRAEFQSTFRFIVPNQSVENVLTVRGRSWARQAYVLPASKLDAAPGEDAGSLESLTQVPLDLLDATVLAPGDASEEPYVVTLEYAKGALLGGADPTAATKQVIVGCAARAAGKESTPVAYEVTFPAGTTAFVVDAPKGSAPAGGSQKLTFKAVVPGSAPPAAAGKGAGAGAAAAAAAPPPPAAPSAAVTVGQWVSCVAKCVVTGGARCGGVPASQTIAVKLRAYLPL